MRFRDAHMGGKITKKTVNIMRLEDSSLFWGGVYHWEEIVGWFLWVWVMFSFFFLVFYSNIIFIFFFLAVQLLNFQSNRYNYKHPWTKTPK